MDNIRPDPDSLGSPIYGTEIELARGSEGADHAHDKIQLIYTVSGLVNLEVGSTMYVVPAGCAIWIPSTHRHRVWGDTPVRLACLYIDKATGDPLREGCEVLFAKPLLRELLLEAVAEGEARPGVGNAQGRRTMVLLDELAAAPAEPLHLPMPTDRRARRVAESLLEDPSQRLSLKDWGHRVGASDRTIARLFVDETGMSFGTWRQHLHIGVALRELAAGQLVTHIALDLGYETASAFIAMFRRRLGTTPARYFPPNQIR
jgi:AraC-like DNA-binding protein